MATSQDMASRLRFEGLDEVELTAKGPLSPRVVSGRSEAAPPVGRASQRLLQSGAVPYPSSRSPRPPQHQRRAPPPPRGDALGAVMSRPRCPSARPWPVPVVASIALVTSVIVTLTISPSAPHGLCSPDRPLAGDRTPASRSPRTALPEELDAPPPQPMPSPAPPPALRTPCSWNIHVPLRA